MGIKNSPSTTGLGGSTGIASAHGTSGDRESPRGGRAGELGEGSAHHFDGCVLVFRLAVFGNCL